MKKYLLIILSLFYVYSFYGQEKQKVSLLFAGDAMQHKSQLDAARVKGGGYDYSKYFNQIKDQIDSADISIVNFETTLPGKAYTGYPNFGSPDEFAYALKDAGFDVFLTANNHCLDKGKKGVERTIMMLDSMQVKHLGTYVNEEKKNVLYPMMIVKNDIRIGMLNYTYDTNGIPIQAPNIVNLIDKKQIVSDIDMLKRMQPDIIVANMHWGEEYKLKPSTEQKALADLLIKNGVRLIIGSHPHVVQPIDIRQNGDSIENIIVYSLGNFISGMKAVNTDGGMIARINISKDDKGNVTIDSCSYSLVWVYKPLENAKLQFQLIPIEKYENKTGEEKIGKMSFDKMSAFAKTARKTIESLWPKSSAVISGEDSSPRKN